MEQPRNAEEDVRRRAMEHHRAGRFGPAGDAWLDAARLDPSHPETRNNLGVALQALGRLDEAAAEFAEATRLRPAYADAWENRAGVLQQLGRSDDAIAVAREMVRNLPGRVPALLVLATTLAAAGRLPEADDACRDALDLAPADVDAQFLLANILAAQQDWVCAANTYAEVVRLAPGALDAHVNLGVCRAAAGQLPEAAEQFRNVMKRDPKRADAALRLADVLERLGEHADAFAAAQRAAQLRPDDPAALNLLASLSDRVGKVDDAEPLYRRALEHDPSHAPALANYATLLARRGEAERAVPMLRKAVEAEPGEPVAHSTLCMYLNAVPGVDGHEVFAEHRRWAERHAPSTPPVSTARPHPDPLPEGEGTGLASNRRLRIGYVSPDWAGHPVARFMQPILESHDRSAFEIYIYDDAPRPDAFTERLRPLADAWHRVRGMPDGQLAEQIRMDGIDVLVDLAGHTAGNRLLVFARKPARIQVSYLGYPNTTGLDAIDYRLTDTLADPVGLADELHTERLIRLPGTAWSFRPPVETPDVAEAPVVQNGFVTFGSFNALWKINGPLLRMWSRALSAVPHSRLIMKADGLERADVAARIAGVFRERGIEADRLTLLGREKTYAGHLAAYGSVDLCLDTFPYAGTTTTCEALWMGVPVVSLVGHVHAARVGASLLSSIGLPELAVDSEDAMVAAVRNLAADVPRVSSLRREMRQRMTRSSLMNPIVLTRAIEQAFWNLAKRSPASRAN